MIIWVDADACPGVVRDIICRAARRVNVVAMFVANKPIALPVSELYKAVQVQGTPDAADAYIVEHAGAGDLTVTQDIPIAAQLVPKGVTVISPRGELFTENNIAERLAGRDLSQELRDIGEITGGPRPFDEKLKRQFASAFDAALHRLTRK